MVGFPGPTSEMKSRFQPSEKITVRKSLLLCAVIASSTLTGLASADAPATAPATQPSTQPAQTTPAKRGSLSIAIDGQGAFDPVDPFEARLRFKVYLGELTITTIARNGAAVKKGDVLLEFDPAAMKRAVAAAENETLAAKATLERAQADAKIAEQSDALALQEQQESLKEADDAVKWFDTVDGPQYLKQTELLVQQAKDQVSDEQDELDQLKKMYKSEELTNATADIVVKRAVRQLGLSQTGLAMARERAEKSKTFNYPASRQHTAESLESAKHQFAAFQASQKQGKVLRKTSLATVTASTELAELHLDEIKHDAELLTVRAPFDGILCYGQITNGTWQATDARNYRVGEHLTAQTVLLTLYQPGRLRVVLDLPEAKFFAINAGQKASISPVAFPEMKYEGMCDNVPRTASGAAGYMMTISTGEVDAKLVPGMKAQVHMDVPLVDNVLLVPTTAVKDSTVWIKTGDKAESRHVMTGRSDGKSIEILSGLHEGDEVLTQAK
jgi:multidrug efflux pump subunit AcrA (membrane-fusion protein)